MLDPDYRTPLIHREKQFAVTSKMCCIIALHRHFARLTYTCWPDFKYICETQSFAMDESILNSSSYFPVQILFSGRATEAEWRAGTSIPGRLG